jgi:hypothetical protein
VQVGMVTAARKVNARSSVFNRPRRLSRTVDGRSLDGRLYVDLFDQLTAEFLDADPVKVREVAILKLASEKAVSSGAWEDVVRLQNLAARKESSLRAAQRVAAAGRLSTVGRPPGGLKNRLATRYRDGAPEPQPVSRRASLRLPEAPVAVLAMGVAMTTILRSFYVYRIDALDESRVAQAANSAWASP